MKLSHSALETYKLCPHKYKFHYVDNYRPTIIGSPLFFGTKVGQAWAQILLPKKQSLTNEEKELIKKDPHEYFDEIMQTVEINGEVQPLPENLNVYYHKGDWDENILNDDDKALLNNYRKAHGFNDVSWEDLYGYYKAGSLDQDELKFLNFHFWISCKRRGHYLIDAYVKDIFPKVLRVYSIEKPINLTNTVGDTFTGFIDLIADIVPEEGKVIKAVIDHKTSSAKYNIRKFEESGQLHFYNYVEELDYVAYIVGIKQVKIPKIGPQKGQVFSQIQIIYQAANPILEEGFIAQADAALQMIKKESFPKNKDACLSFGAKCPFYEICMGDGSMKGLIQKEKK